MRQDSEILNSISIPKATAYETFRLCVSKTSNDLDDAHHRKTAKRERKRKKKPNDEQQHMANKAQRTTATKSACINSIFVSNQLFRFSRFFPNTQIMLILEYERV